MAALTETIQIVNKLGLHARAAAKFVKVACQFSSEITLERNEQTANGKSIMSILMLAAEKGSAIKLTVEGSDQDQAFETTKKLILEGFGE